MKRLNCFISYHHRDDLKYVEQLRDIYKNITVSDYSLDKDMSHKDDEQIYNNIRFRMNHCAVTIVLISKHTWKRKWVDWEIWASLEPYLNKNVKFKDGFRPSGILAIFLPNAKKKNNSSHKDTKLKLAKPFSIFKPKIKRNKVPKRLQDNIDSGYVVNMEWPHKGPLNSKDFVRKLMIASRMRRHTLFIDNSRKRMKYNRTWYNSFFNK